MNNRIKHLPVHWQKWVETHPKLSKGESVDEFKDSVSLNWEDGSNAIFEYAFIVWDEKREEICVFTEHSGYHVFRTDSSLKFSNIYRSEIIKVN